MKSVGIGVKLHTNLLNMQASRVKWKSPHPYCVFEMASEYPGTFLLITLPFSLLAKILDVEKVIYISNKIMRCVHCDYELWFSYFYADAVSLLDLMPSIDLKIGLIRAPCIRYPPITRRIAFSGLENVIIKLAFGRAGLLPTITRRLPEYMHTDLCYILSILRQIVQQMIASKQQPCQ